jgi:hypothetical protein
MSRGCTGHIQAQQGRCVWAAHHSSAPPAAWWKLSMAVACIRWSLVPACGRVGPYSRASRCCHPPHDAEWRQSLPQHITEVYEQVVLHHRRSSTAAALVQV